MCEPNRKQYAPEFDPVNKAESTGGFARFRKEWLEPILITFLIFAIIQTFIFQQFKIPSGSMEDTLLVGDRLVALKFCYGIRLPFKAHFLVRYGDPKPGDVIVFKYPRDPSKDFIKRCIAVGGQTVEIRDRNVYVDGILQEFPDTAKFTNEYSQAGDYYALETVPEQCMFVMGDNRQNSNDSRYWGFVPYDNIVGKAVIVLWSWNFDVPLYNILKRIRWTRFFRLIH